MHRSIYTKGEVCMLHDNAHRIFWMGTPWSPSIRSRSCAQWVLLVSVIEEASEWSAPRRRCWGQDGCYSGQIWRQNLWGWVSKVDSMIRSMLQWKVDSTSFNEKIKQKRTIYFYFETVLTLIPPYIITKHYWLYLCNALLYENKKLHCRINTIC